MKTNTKTGKVYLVGAGPGDPGLLTVKGKACIQKAQVLVYDYLASPELLQYASKDAEQIYVGKKGGDHTLAQDKINELLVEKAQQGLIVTRLKGGDPFIFGRGGEEAEVLQQAGIEFDIVPGVTSAISAPAYAGIPLTHRKFTSTLAFVTGHEDPTKEKSNIDWAALAKAAETIVFLMGIKNLPNITANLIKNGLSPDTPVGIIRWGTFARQKTVIGTLKTISDICKAQNIKPPAIIVVGQVVTLRDTLSWFEKRPLFGKRIVVTRSREQASQMIQSLTDLGAECLQCPTIEVKPSKDLSDLDLAIFNLNSYDWLVFTSVNGVNFFFERLFQIGKDVRVLSQIKTACIGPVTAQRLRDFGINTDILPDSYRAESIIEAFQNEYIVDQKFLLPRAEEARPILPEMLVKMGAHVNEIKTYQTVKVDDAKNELIQRLESKTLDMVTFTSSSTVRNFKELLPQETFRDLIGDVTIACIGPVTADTAKELGFTPHIVADTYTIPGLIDAILTHYHG